MNTTIEIQNLKCGGCANTITSKLSNLIGIQKVVVDNETNTVSFDYENEKTLLATQDMLAKLGYPTVGEKNAITTKAKSLVSCAVGRLNK
jgi:copper chaperone CopZ